MRALAHPVRMRLLEELVLRGPMTATQCSEYVGESPSSCSFHLRTLAKYGFVEEAEGGTGRQRPWRPVALGNRWSDDPEAPAGDRTAAATLAAQVRRRDQELLQQHLATSDELPEEWRKATIHSNYGGWMTPAELAEVSEQVHAMLRPYLNRLMDPTQRPDGARLVHLFLHGFPRPEPISAADPSDTTDTDAAGPENEGPTDA